MRRNKIWSFILPGLLLVSLAYAEPSQQEIFNAPQKPFRVFGNTYYVGTHGLSSVLITSDDGHILIDGGLPESADKIAGNVRALGFKVEDIKFILNSHAHADHAGGIAALQRMSGATVMASPSGAAAIRQGQVGRDDPQFEGATPYAGASNVKSLQDETTLTLGAIAITAHFTPGHTPGGTSWSWNSCEGTHCESIVYADSLTSISSENFKFTSNSFYPNVVADFEHSIATLAALPCHILLSAHPEFSDTWEKLEKSATDKKAFIDVDGCRKYASNARAGLMKRLEKERAQK